MHWTLASVATSPPSPQLLAFPSRMAFGVTLAVILSLFDTFIHFIVPVCCPQTWPDPLARDQGMWGYPLYDGLALPEYNQRGTRVKTT